MQFVATMVPAITAQIMTIYAVAQRTHDFNAQIMQRSRNLARLSSLSLLLEPLFVAAKSLVRLNLPKTTKMNDNDDDNDRGKEEEPLETNARTREMRAFEM